METNHFNGLTEAEHERLSIMMEECGEVVGIIGKILRHGYNNHHPDDLNKVTNRELLEKELGDVLCSMFFMQNNNDVDEVSIKHNAFTKSLKLPKYLHHHDGIISADIITYKNAENDVILSKLLLSEDEEK